MLTALTRAWRKHRRLVWMSVVAGGMVAASAVAEAQAPLVKLSKADLEAAFAGGKRLEIIPKAEDPRILYFYGDGRFMQCADDFSPAGKSYLEGDQMCASYLTAKRCLALYRNAHGDLFLKWTSPEDRSARQIKPVRLSPIHTPESCT